MNDLGNVFLCLVAPYLFAILFLTGYRRRMLLFFTAGMTFCLFSAYISTCLTAVLEADMLSATFEITPMVEEMMKLFPVLFYFLVFEPRKEQGAGGVLMVSVGFATFENICYLMANGASDVVPTLMRGLGTGSMHVSCGAVVAIGFLYMWDGRWYCVVGTMGLLSVATTFHAIYNLLIAQSGIIMWIGFMLPILTMVSVLSLGRSILRQMVSD